MASTVRKDLKTGEERRGYGPKTGAPKPKPEKPATGKK